MLLRTTLSAWKYLFVALLAILAFSSATVACIARDCLCKVRQVDTLTTFPNSRAGVPTLNPATGLLYVAIHDAMEIAVYDAAQLDGAPPDVTPLAHVPTYGYVDEGGIAVDARANKLYVAQSFAERVRVIDGDTHDYHDIVVPGLVNALGHIAIDPDRRRLYAARVDNFDIAVFDTATEAFLGTIGQGCCKPGNVELAADPHSGLLWVLDTGRPARLTVWQGGGRRLAEIPVDGEPRTIALAPRAGRAYVTQPAALSIAVIDAAPESPAAFTVVDRITLREKPSGIRVNPDATRAYTGNPESGTLSVIDLSIARHVMDVPIGPSAFLPALDPLTSHVYLAAQTSRIAVVQGCPVPRRAKEDASRRSAQAAARRAARVALARPSATPGAAAAAALREFVRCNRMFLIRENCHVGPDVREAALVHATVEAAGGHVLDGGAAGQFCGIEPDAADSDLAAAGSYYSVPLTLPGADEPVVWTFHSSTRTFGENAVPADAVITRVATPPASPWAEALWYVSRRKTRLAPDAMCEHLPPTPVRAAGAGRTGRAPRP